MAPVVVDRAVGTEADMVAVEGAVDGAAAVMAGTATGSYHYRPNLGPDRVRTGRKVAELRSLEFWLSFVCYLFGAGCLNLYVTKARKPF
jgi:hypothetical protein